MKKKTVFIIISFVCFRTTQAQLKVAQKNEVIDSAINLMNTAYIFPQVAEKAAAFIRMQQKNKVYDTITDVNVFADRLTADFVSMCHDKHIHIFYSGDIIPYKPLDQLMSIPEREREGYGEFLKHINYGINKLDVLQGNIGYLDFKVLCGPEFAGDVYTSIMEYLSHTEALIIDLRNCGGSFSPNAVPFICSYFLDIPTHLTDTYYNDSTRFQQSWTYAYVPGKRYLDKPLFILVSNNTFSGAEEFAYDLKVLKRATIIGTQTGGGANPGGELRLTEHFGMFVPVGQVTNSISKTNWEGIGVIPDSVADPRAALYKAQLMAMQHSLTTTNDENWKGGLKQWIATLEHNPPIFVPVTFQLKGYANAKSVYVTGTFNSWLATNTKLEKKNNIWTTTITAEPGDLMYKFIVDGTYILDPANPKTKNDNEAENSLIKVE